jgi:hypothetical protein
MDEVYDLLVKVVGDFRYGFWIGYFAVFAVFGSSEEYFFLNIFPDFLANVRRIINFLINLAGQRFKTLFSPELLLLSVPGSLMNRNARIYCVSFYINFLLKLTNVRMLVERISNAPLSGN